MATKYQPVIQELVDLINKNGWADKFNEAINKTKALHIKDMEDIQNLDDLLDWMNRYVTWVPRENRWGSLCLEHLCKFFYIFDQSPVKELQTPETPAVPQPALTPFSAWIKKFIQVQGEFLDTPESLTPETLATFYAAPNYNMDEYVCPRGGWKTFNEWFARRTKPGYRPIAAIDDDHVIGAAAEATFSGQWEISNSNKVNC